MKMLTANTNIIKTTTFIVLLAGLVLLPRFAEAQGYLMLAGGGSESSSGGSWSAEPYSWFVDKAGDKPIVVLSNSDASTWIPNYFLSFGATEVFNLTIQGNTSAEIAEALDGAGGVFMKGGDQRNYIDSWKDTEIADLIRAVFDDGGVVGGTSAGAMVAGEFMTRGGTSSDQHLRNPYVVQNDIQTGFLDFIPRTIVDTHYFERGRIGRLIGMVAYIATEHGEEPVTGIGIDDQTAVLIYPDGQLRVSGTGGVHVLRTDSETVIDALPNQDLMVRDMIVHQLTHGFAVDLATGAITQQPDDTEEVATMPDYQLDAIIHFRRNGWTTAYLDDKSGDNQRVLLDGGEVNTSAIENDEITVDIVPWTSTLSGDADAINELFDGDRLFVNISAAQWLELSSSELFRSRLEGSPTELELLMRHLPVSGDGYATNLSDNGFIAYDGRIQTREGSGFFTHVVSVDSTYLNQNQYENRASAPGWLMRNFESGIALSGTRFSELTYNNGELSFENQLMPVLIMEAREGYLTAASPFITSGSAAGPRNSAAVSYGRMHVLPDGESFRLYDAAPVSIGEPEFDDELPREGFRLEAAYPNPFNPSTTIALQSSGAMDGRIEVFNVLGQRVMKLPGLRFTEGLNRFSITLDNRSTGVYLVRVQAGNQVETMRITLVK